MSDPKIQKVTGIYIELDGKEKINIRDLSKIDYENFLESMNNIRMAYLTLTRYEKICKDQT